MMDSASKAVLNFLLDCLPMTCLQHAYKHVSPLILDLREQVNVKMCVRKHTTVMLQQVHVNHAQQVADIA